MKRETSLSSKGFVLDYVYNTSERGVLKDYPLKDYKPYWIDYQKEAEERAREKKNIEDRETLLNNLKELKSKQGDLRRIKETEKSLKRDVQSIEARYDYLISEQSAEGFRFRAVEKYTEMNILGKSSSDLYVSKFLERVFGLCINIYTDTNYNYNRYKYCTIYDEKKYKAINLGHDASSSIQRMESLIKMAHDETEFAKSWEYYRNKDVAKSFKESIEEVTACAIEVHKLKLEIHKLPSMYRIIPNYKKIERVAIIAIITLFLIIILLLFIFI